MIRENYPYLNDSNFIEKIDTQHLQEQYVRLILLNWEEEPLQEIQGIATNGTISINGNSSVRRTCSLNLNIKYISDGKITDINNLISIGKKVYLEIGVKNNTNKYLDYPIIWFPQGIFVFTACSSNTSVSGGTSLSAQLKDKMCLLNGECGGIIPASTQFDTWETINENGEWAIEKPTIAQIIREAVNHFGGEQLGRILISDIDEKVKMVMRWTGKMPVYLINSQGNYELTTNKTKYESAGIQEFGYGDDVGFTYTDFTYPEELIANPGDNICTAVLDKIKTTLGNYEYFYDINGNFIFQEIKDYLNTTQATVDLEHMKNEDYLIDISRGKAVYDFSNNDLITSISNSPQYTRIKNDFVIWGTRTDSNDIQHAVRYHLAIDTKPKTGNIYKVFFYTDPEDNWIKPNIPVEFNTINDFPKTGLIGVYYLDLSTNIFYKWDEPTKEYVEIVDAESKLKYVQTTDWRSELYLQGIAAEPLGLRSNYYYTELSAEWPKLYNLQADSYIDDQGRTIYTGAFYEDVLNYPWDVDYWLDFIDSETAIAALNIKNIGRRSLCEQEDDYNCVFEPEVPDFILIESGQPDTQEKREECIARAQSFIQVEPNIFEYIAIGGWRNSCFNRVKEALYDYTNYNNAVSISSLPIFHLEPNIRIHITNKESDIFGDYLINSISIPLDIGGTMNISAQKCSEKL